MGTFLPCSCTPCRPGEYPGLTSVEPMNGVYVVDLKRAQQALNLLDGTALAAGIASTGKLDG